MSYRLFLAVFYIVLLAICMCGQMAILIKKCIEHQKDEMDANVPNNQGMNNQRWNHHLCSNPGTMSIILVIFLKLLTKYIQAWWIITLNKEEAVHLNDIFDQFVYCICIPIIIYARNDKLYKYVKNEISDLIYS